MDKYRIKLKGVHNFRDIGGYDTCHGQKVKTGMIYRSGGLSKLRKTDIQKIKGLGIKLVIDLRSEQEREYQPSRLQENDFLRIENLCFSHTKTDLKALYQKTLSGKQSNFNFHEFFLAEYRAYVTQHNGELEKIFELLLDGNNYPILIHCNGGKDRTGTVTAMIHMALGVAKEHVFHDYMLSQEHLKRFIKKMTLKIRLFSFFQANIAQLTPLLDTNSIYLQEALDTIDDHHGSVDSYLEFLGLNGESRLQLNQLLCRN